MYVADNLFDKGGIVPKDKANDLVFEQEQKHLKETYSKLLKMRSDITRKIEETNKQAAEDKMSMAEDLTTNFATFDDTLETLASYEAVNRVIDSYNMAQGSNVRMLVDIELLLEQPYFAKIVLQYNPDEDPRELYIGAAGISDDMCKRLIVDWRSPVAEVFYNQENGHTSYKANGRIIDVDLKLRRQFDIKKDTLKAYFDTTVAIQDPMLLKSLNTQRTDALQAITATIQKEQNVVVRHDDVAALLVSGVAGSGKTSVMLQRIAYLFYQQRDTLDPSQVVMLTPNPVFSRYIENVLPEMGESNPVSLTWDELMHKLLPSGHHKQNTEESIDVFDKITKGISDLVLTSADFIEIRANGNTLISAQQIEQLMQKFSNAQMGPHRITLVREKLLERLNKRLESKKVIDEIRDEFDELSIDNQIARFGMPLDLMEPNDPDLRDCLNKEIKKRYATALQAVENDEWLRIDRIGMRMLSTKSLSPTEWLYTKMALTGMCNSDTKYVFIDEVQDYSLAQLFVLAAYYRRAHFIMLGDENQSIKPSTASFREILQFFKNYFGEAQECNLQISYRSTPAITKLFSRLAKPNEMEIASVQRTDDKPTILQFSNQKSYEQKLCRVIKDSVNLSKSKNIDSGLTAIIVPWKSELKRIAKILGDDAPQIITSTESLPQYGAMLITLKLAKGLEFDNVIIPDASMRLFPNDDISRRRLYTSISRATKNITILSNGKLTELLAQ